MIDDLPPLREVIKRHDLRARKSLGQNFLLDLNLTARIARAAGPLDGAPARIVANLPYNIATALLVGWLTAEPWPPWFDRLVLMFQREVAERITAAPGSKTYGRLSVLAGWRTEARILFDVAPSAFVPPPKVTSSLVELVPRRTPLPCESVVLQKVTEAAFGQRRKMLRQSLKSLGRDPLPLLAAADIEPTARAEEIPVEGFVRLARIFAGDAP